MAPIVCAIEISCPPEEVYAYATDPTRFSEWQRDVVGVRLATTGRPGLGSRFTTTRRIGRSERTMTQEITEINPPFSWAARGVDGPVRPNAAVAVERLGNGAGARATFTLDFEGYGLGDLLVPVVQRMTAKQAPASFQKLKELLERVGKS